MNTTGVCRLYVYPIIFYIIIFCIYTVIDTSGVNRFDRKPTKYNIMMYIYTIMDTSGVYRFNKKPKKTLGLPKSMLLAYVPVEP